MSSSRRFPPLLQFWTAWFVVLLIACLAARCFSYEFGPEAAPASMPIVPFAVIMTFVGLIFLTGIPLIARTPRALAARQSTIFATFVAGLLLRFILLGSAPILEVDYNRYLWDGGLVAHGHNPYAVAPARIATLPYDDPRLELSKNAGTIFERISYRAYKTIYPPVAQAAFAIAHVMAPWSLTAWRWVCIGADALAFGFLIALLRSTGRSELWSTLYWWNPLVLKEVVNSAHVEAILTPLVLATLLATLRGRHVVATGLLALAIGTKLWPVLLAPLVLRPLVTQPRQLMGALALMAAMSVAFAVPVWHGGLDATSGFIGFARDWSTNSALFPLSERLVAVLLGTSAAVDPQPGVIVRLLSVAALSAVAVGLAIRPIDDAGDLVARAFLLTTAVLLLSPVQFPWYVLWVLPLAVLRPGTGWHFAAAVLPLYYLSFHFLVRGTFAAHHAWIVGCIWIPVWLGLSADAFGRRRRHDDQCR